MNAKKPLRSQHNIAKENNYQKKKKNFTGFYTEENPEFGFGFAFVFVFHVWLKRLRLEFIVCFL